MVLPRSISNKLQKTSPRRRKRPHQSAAGDYRSCNSVALLIMLIMLVYLQPSTTPSTHHQLELMLLDQDEESSSVVNEAIRRRHDECIASIRDRHDQAWPELLMLQQQQQGSGTILLIDPVMHQINNNVGATMQTVAEEQYLSRLGWDVVECDYLQPNDGILLPQCTDDFLQEFSEEGGVKFAAWHTSSVTTSNSWDDAWRSVDQGKQNNGNLDSFVSLLTLGYSIICLPQHLSYQQDDEGREEQEHDAIIRRKILEGLDLSDLDTPENVDQSKSRITFTWSDEESYLKAIELYSYVQNKLVPDIAFQLGPFNSTKNYWKQVDILLLLQQDDDSGTPPLEVDDRDIQKYLVETPYGATLEFKIVDWKDRLEIFSSNSSFFDQTSIERLSLGRVVITDRFYAAVMAYLSGLPFVYLETPSSQHIADPLSVALNESPACRNETSGLWSRVASLEEAVQQAAKYLSTYPIP
jgi:hypothetical protein